MKQYVLVACVWSPCGLSGHVYSWSRLLIGSFNTNKIISLWRWAGVSAIESISIIGKWDARQLTEPNYSLSSSEHVGKRKAASSIVLVSRWETGDAYLFVSGSVESCLALSDSSLESRTKRSACSLPLAVLQSKRQIKMHLMKERNSERLKYQWNILLVISTMFPCFKNA